MKRKYKVGERYIVTNKACYDDRKGNIIEITGVNAKRVSYKVIEQKGKADYFVNFSIGSLFDRNLIPVKNECIVIYRKGSEVIALDKSTNEKAVAKCHPGDEFDFNVGAKLAFERLLGVAEIPFEPLKLLNTEICITKSDNPEFITGKIYRIVDGKITGECSIWPMCKSFKDIDDTKEYFADLHNRKGSFKPHFNQHGIDFVEVVR